MKDKPTPFENKPYVEEASVPGDNDFATALDPALAKRGYRRAETGTIEQAALPLKTIEAREFDPKAQVLDIRKHTHNEQIRGAVRYDPKKLLEAGVLALPLAKENRVVLCADDEKSARAVASRLSAEGYRDVVLLLGGNDEWKAQGLAMEPATQEQPVPGEEDAGIHLL